MTQQEVLGLGVAFLLAMIPLYNLVTNHYEKKQRQALDSLSKQHDYEKQQLEAMKELTLSINTLDNNINTLSSDIKSLQTVQTDMFNDFLDLETQVHENRSDIELIKKTIFIKDRV